MRVDSQLKGTDPAGDDTETPADPEPTAETPTDEVDIVVIGAGPVGENVAQYAIEGTDLTAVLVEAERFGGECSYWACIPSKALLRPVTVGATTHHLGGLTPSELDHQGMLGRRDDWVRHYDDVEQVEWAQKAGIRTVRGRGRIVAEREVEVVEPGQSQPRRFRARRAVVLATGSTPVVPEGFVDAHAWGSRDVTGVREVPDRLLVVGGGAVACEASTWMAALGSGVTMIVRGGRLLSQQEPFAGETVAGALRDAGVEVVLGTAASGCERRDSRDTGVGRIHGGPVTVLSGDERFEGDELLLATGRRPRLDDLGLEAVGMSERDVLRGRLPTWLYAVGDASGEAQVTHWGKYRARVVGGRIAAMSEGVPSPYTPAYVPVPQVVFTDPQVATVGATEQAAREDGHDVVTATVALSSVPGAALLRDDVTGRAKIVVDRTSGLLLGATFVGHAAGELIHSATVAIVGQVPVNVLRHAVPTFPTASELWLQLLEDLPRELRRPR